jgi:hypothetical protein
MQSIFNNKQQSITFLYDRFVLATNLSLLNILELDAAGRQTEMRWQCPVLRYCLVRA